MFYIGNLHLILTILFNKKPNPPPYQWFKLGLEWWRWRELRRSFPTFTHYHAGAMTSPPDCSPSPILLLHTLECRFLPVQLPMLDIIQIGQATTCPICIGGKPVTQVE